MNYREMIEKALKGRSINSMAKLWGVQQVTLNRYVRGERMPDYSTGLKIAREAGINPAEAFEIFAAEEQAHKVKNFKLQMGFVQTDLLLFIATGGLSCLFYIMSNCLREVCPLRWQYLRGLILRFEAPDMGTRFLCAVTYQYCFRALAVPSEYRSDCFTGLIEDDDLKAHATFCANCIEKIFHPYDSVANTLGTNCFTEIARYLLLTCNTGAKAAR